MGGPAGGPATQLGEVVLGIQQPQAPEQLAAGGKCRGGRRGHPGEATRVGHAPARQFEGQRGKVGLAHLRLAVGNKRLLLGPQPQAKAGALAAGAASALVGAGAVDPARLQAGQAASPSPASPWTACAWWWTPSTVTLDSAMAVASTTRRRLSGSGRRARR